MVVEFNRPLRPMHRTSRLAESAGLAQVLMALIVAPHAHAAAAPGRTAALVWSETVTTWGTRPVDQPVAVITPATSGGQLAVAPDGSQVAFVGAGSSAGSRAVWSSELDGGGAVRLTDGSSDAWPTWSPAGDFVVFSRRASSADPWMLTLRLLGPDPAPTPLALEGTRPDVSADYTLAFERGGQVYTLAADAAAESALTTGGDPAFSPDGAQVAFVRAVAGVDQVFRVPVGGGPVTRVTTSERPSREPAWSPDGTRIAVTREVAPAEQEVVEVRVAEGTEGQVSPAGGATVGGPSYVGVPSCAGDFGCDGYTRVAGTDRVSTAVSASKAFGAGAAGAVVLSRSDTFADALAGGALAAGRGGPLLLTGRTGLDSRVEAEIRRVLPPGGTVYLLGGTSALSSGIQSRLGALGFTARRLAGDDRYQTAATVASAVPGGRATVFLATGTDFPDALAAGAAAGAYGAAVLLTSGPTLPAATRTFLQSAAPVEAYAIGGPAAAAARSAGVALAGPAIVGSDRYDTAVRVADRLFYGPYTVGLATGVNFPDALAGGALLGQVSGPLLLTPPGALSPRVRSYLAGQSASVRNVWAFGGVAAVSGAALTTAAAQIGLEPTAKPLPDITAGTPVRPGASTMWARTRRVGSAQLLPTAD